MKQSYGLLTGSRQATETWTDAEDLVVTGKSNIQYIRALEHAEQAAQERVRQIDPADFQHVKVLGMQYRLQEILENLQHTSDEKNGRDDVLAINRPPLINEARTIIAEFGGLKAAGLTEDAFMEITGQPYNPLVRRPVGQRRDAKAIEIARAAAG